MAGSSHHVLILQKKYPPPPAVFPLLPSSPEKSYSKWPETSISGNSTIGAKKLYLNFNGELALPTFIVWPSEDAEH